MITEFAPAKINLALHVTGKREDGYHLLDSAVMFASDTGDTLKVSLADKTSLTVSGRFSKDLEPDSGNLVLNALSVLQERYPGQVQPCAITLRKELPVASGIGGGSADAAAALRAFVSLNGLTMDASELADIGLQLGADVPVCLAPTACRMRGIGEIIDDWEHAPSLHAVLVNPLIGVSTAGIFKRLGLSPGTIEEAGLSHDFNAAKSKDATLSWLAGCRNDLQSSACLLQPVISDVLQALRQLPDCRISRMSGSGATCFGLFEDAVGAHAAAENLSGQRDDWWVAATSLV